MNRIALLFFIGALFLCQEACRSRQQTENRAPDSTATADAEASSETAPKSTITGRLADLGLTPNSDWRGINFGDAFTKVKAAEKGEPFESDAGHSGYTVELKNLETADILYYQTAKKVSAIDVDLFLNSRQSVTDYQKELEPYFTARFGTPKPGTGGTVWTGQHGAVVTLKDVSKGKDFGLKIKIAPTNSLTTVSVK